MSTEKPRYTITLDDELLKKIDDFRFENRYPSRTQATLELIRLGIETLEKQQSIDSKNDPYSDIPYTADEFNKKYFPDNRVGGGD